MRLSLVFLLLIPAFIALGHDIYLFHERFLSPGVFSIDLLMKEFKFSALGFIWTTYAVDSYKSVVESVSPEDWATIDSFLTLKAFYAGLGFAGIVTVLFMILAKFGIGPFVEEEGGRTSKQKDDPSSFRAGGKSKKMNYKRK